jgi:hypothetical protein
MKLATFSQVPISAEAVRAEFKKAPRARTQDEPEATESVEMPMPSEREFWLLKYLFANDEAADWAKSRLDLSWIHHATVREIVARRFNDEWRGVPALLDQSEDGAFRSLLTAAVAQEIEATDLLKKVRETSLLIRNDHLDRELQKLKLHLNQPELSQADVVNTLQLQAQLRKLKQQPLA